MKNFFLGLIAGIFLVPFVNNLEALGQQITEHFCAKIALKTLRFKEQIEKLSVDNDNAFAIGFQLPNEEEIYDEEEEE